MTADVLPPAPERKPNARTPKVVAADPRPFRRIDARTLAIERCADQIARAMGRLTLEQRIVVEHALDDLADEIAWHTIRPWY